MIVDFEITDPRYCVKIPVPELGKEIKITLRKLKKAFYWEDGLMEVVMDIEYGEDYCWQSMAGVSLKGKCLLEIVEEALYQNIRRNLMGEVDGYRRLPELPSTCGFFYRYTFRKLCWWLREQAEFSFDIEGKAEDGSAIRAKYRSDGWWGNAERRGMAVGKRRCGGGPESDRRILPRLLLCKTGWNHVLQKNAFLVLYGERRKVQRRRLALLWADLPEDMEMGGDFCRRTGGRTVFAISSCRGHANAGDLRAAVGGCPEREWGAGMGKAGLRPEYKRYMERKKSMNPEWRQEAKERLGYLIGKGLECRASEWFGQGSPALCIQNADKVSGIFCCENILDVLMATEQCEEEYGICIYYVMAVPMLSCVSLAMLYVGGNPKEWEHEWQELKQQIPTVITTRLSGSGDEKEGREIGATRIRIVDGGLIRVS